MIVPLEYIVETVALTANDAMLPLMESVVNAVISLMQSTASDKKIEIRITRGDFPVQRTLENIKTIDSVVITDNGIGFTNKNFISFETPFSKLNKDLGCKGIGRFTILAAFQQIVVRSNYQEMGKWMYREFSCDSTNEIVPLRFEESTETIFQTTVELNKCFNPVVKERTAVTASEIAEEIMHHCLVYYLSGELPLITIIDDEYGATVIVNELFEKVSKENEKTFNVETHSFKAYITKTLKEGNRKNHYAYFCANSRVVGQPHNLGKLNSLFTTPLQSNGKWYFLDVYVVSNYLNKHVFPTRNGFAIPISKENRLFDYSDLVSLEEIELELSRVLEEEYQGFVKEVMEAKEKEIRNYVQNKAPRYQNLIKNNDVIKSIPTNLSEDKIEEHLYRASFQVRKSIEKRLEDLINDKQLNEDSIKDFQKNIREKAAYDSDSLADYMIRRKAILDVFEKFLEADQDGTYKLEEDIHNLIFPMGFTSDEVKYEGHNLWLLDERFLTYKFIASDKAITSFSQVKSSKEPDLALLAEVSPPMFDNPISFGDKSAGDLNSMVIFEFKRPGDVAHQKKKGDFQWDFAELIVPYFDAFQYGSSKKNYKGRQVVLKRETPKFGYVILDIIPPQLEQYNLDKGWQKTPFGTYYRMTDTNNLHIEVMTFTKLLEYARARHSPFFDRLFGAV